jgi:methionine sulfoxide reductase catalytic subunit
MLIRKTHLSGADIPSSQITPLDVYLTEKPESASRRDFLTRAATIAAGSAAAALIPRSAYAADPLKTVPGAAKFQTSETQTPFIRTSSYNNFYEFGVPKDQPAKNAHTLRTRPWTVQVTGMVKKPQTVNIDDLIAYRPLESRVYRHRCVEAWSMVIPWDGYSLSEFINFCEPLPGAKYVQFLSLYDHKQMPEAPSDYDWPYSEGLRMDEAMNPLALLTFGCYGQPLPNQNGAPVRIVLPWKWGYKSAKSIVKFNFTDKQPRTLWNEANPGEYGFYSNVNPKTGVRYSQARERRIDTGFPHEIDTQLFNGYGDQVASMYAGMNLMRDY